MEDENLIYEVLERASELMNYYDVNWSDGDKIARINYNELSSELARVLTHDRYYLVHNIWFSKGKQKVKRRLIEEQ